MSLERKVVNLPTSEDGLFIQPSAASMNSADYEQGEHLRRQMFVNRFQYADQNQGDPRTYDPQGNYLCGHCNVFAEPKSCLVVIGNISGEKGSCRHWENKCAGDPELNFGKRKINQDMAVYGESNEGGFGCKRCEYHEKANISDSRGRPLFCKRGAFRVSVNSCCALNEL